MPLLRPRAVRIDKPSPGRMPVGAADQDTNLKALIKWIPTEVIGAYQAIIAAIPVAETAPRLWLSALGIPVCAAWIAFATKPEKAKPAWRQIILSSVAFSIWAAAVQSEVLPKIFGWWQTWMGTVLLLFSAILLPILDGILKAIGLTQGE
jgi:hypothetical protein